MIIHGWMRWKTSMLFWKIDRKSDTMAFRSEDGYVQKDEAKKTGKLSET